MKIYKDKQFLVFDFEDGKTVKYDFATKECIGKKGKPVSNLCSQLRGLSIDKLCDCCTDKNYGRFLRFVKKNGCYYDRDINNIGTILSRVPHFARFEQLFSAGLDDIIDGSNFSYTINDIPKGLIKLCKNHNIKLSNDFLKEYKKNPDAYLLAYNLEYISLTSNDIYDILTHISYEEEYYGMRVWEYRTIPYSTINCFLNEYGYTMKALMNYIDYLKTFEAIEDIDYLMTELADYVSVMKQISPRFDKYPRHFLTTHKIACRNYNRLKVDFAENIFKSRINKDMEQTFGDYVFIYPNCTQEIKDEAVSQNNCVASYIQKVIDGNCHILFLRRKDSLDKSLVTIEVRNNKIVQARQRFNDPITTEQQEAVDKWNKWWGNKIKEKEKNESEELKNAS